MKMKQSFDGKNIVLAVSGSIAAYKASDLTSMLVKSGANVYPLMSRAATNILAPETLRALSGHEVLIDTFDIFDSSKISHIELAKLADVFVLAPGSANTIAKFANGIADNMITDVFLACTCPVLIAPAMNTNMWNNSSTQKNIDTLVKRGLYFSGPTSGDLACRTSGIGKLNSIENIFDDIEYLLHPKKQLKKRVLVTAGASIENIDPVRYISNRSTGKMGYAIAQAAANRGAEVCLLSGNTNLALPQNVDTRFFMSSSDLFSLMKNLYSEFDVIIQAAAPADYTVVQYSNSKIKKNDAKLTIQLKRTPDIAEFIGKNKKSNQIFVGFAAETDNVINNAKEKLFKKNLDFIVLNNVMEEGAGFGVDTNIVTIIDKNTSVNYKKMLKKDLADIILDKVIDILEEK